MVSAKEVKWVMVSALFSVGIAGRVGRRASDPADRREYGDYEDADGYGHYRDEEAPNNKQNYFQEIYLLQSAPERLEFGHVCENPEEWEQRYEKKDFQRNRHQGKHRPEEDRYEFGYRRGNDLHTRERYEKAGPFDGRFKTKVRWADRNGGHGEHYWDYNHGGGAGGEEEDVYVEETRPEPPRRQQYKRQTTRREGSTDAEDFLRSFRENVGPAFGLAEPEEDESFPWREVGVGGDGSGVVDV